MADQDERFGTPTQAVADAIASHGANNPIARIGMYVPTRGEVASMPAKDLLVILDHWMWEGPAELIPTVEQIRDVRAVLCGRADAARPEVRALIAACDDYLR